MKVFIVSRNDCADLDIEGVFDTRDAACKFMVQQGGPGVVIEREMADAEPSNCGGTMARMMQTTAAAHGQWHYAGYPLGWINR